MSKYHSRKIIVNGEKFDSKKEYARFKELSLLEKAGVITNLQRQVRYELIPAHYEKFERYGKTGNRLKDGRKCVERAVDYIADFVYEKDEKTVVEDTKGFKTKEYIIKRKLMLYRYGIKISEV
jgi:uncharacterized protein YbcC (UPF0753/DUF2309 family)